MKQTKKGGFTLPGEAGCEALTLELADRWGADVIRDSDGTELSDEILDAGYSIYSTICLIRDHNEWAREHPDCLQQTFLTTRPCLAGEGPLSVALAVVFLSVGAFVFAGADYSFTQPEPLTGVALWSTMIAGITLIASGPLSYTISSDFARYLPEKTSP